MKKLNKLMKQYIVLKIKTNTMESGLVPDFLVWLAFRAYLWYNTC